MSPVRAAPRTRRPGRRESDSTPLILPSFRPPQLATLERRVPAGDNWLFEMKFDGYRTQTIVGDGEAVFRAICEGEHEGVSPSRRRAR